jgi:predicted N-formylglutamate amidohydrolase
MEALCRCPPRAVVALAQIAQGDSGLDFTISTVQLACPVANRLDAELLTANYFGLLLVLRRPRDDDSLLKPRARSHDLTAEWRVLGQLARSLQDSLLAEHSAVRESSQRASQLKGGAIPGPQ